MSVLMVPSAAPAPAQSLEPLDNAAARASKGLDIHLSTPGPLESLKSLLAREGRGRGQIRLVVALEDGQEVEFDLGQGFRLWPEIRQAIKAVPGVVMQERLILHNGCHPRSC